MAAAARGEGFEIAFGGRTQLQFAPDTARVFVAAARAATEGARVFHLGGPAVTLAETARAIEAAAPGVSIAVDEETILPFPEEFDGTALEEAIGPIAWTPLAEGVGRRSSGCEPRRAERRSRRAVAAPQTATSVHSTASKPPVRSRIAPSRSGALDESV